MTLTIGASVDNLVTHTCSQGGGISRQQMAHQQGLRASIPSLEGMPREEPPRPRIHHSRKMGCLRVAMQPLVISKKVKVDESNGASSFNISRFYPRPVRVPGQLEPFLLPGRCTVVDW